MPKPVVVYFLIVAAAIFFLSTTPHPGPRRRGARRLHVAFDPPVDELERRVLKKGMHDVEAFREKLDSEPGMLTRYFGEEGSLNTTERLMYLFPLLDQAPKDGFISFPELDLWNKKRAMDRLMHSTERKMRIHDKNHDSKVTLSEFSSHIPEEERDWNKEEHGKPGWWKVLFVNADIDGNGSLNETEFTDFLHPEDSINPKVQAWFQEEMAREMDENQDGKLSFEEFRDHTYALFSYTPEFEAGKDVKPEMTRAEQKFAELDVNKDKYLTAAELKPIIHQLHPGEFSHAMYYTKYLMYKADDNKDGKLSLREMLIHHHEFYNAVFEEDPNNYHDDDDHEYYGHDEFR